MKRAKHIKRAVNKGYGPSKNHTFETQTNKCIVCGLRRFEVEGEKIECFPKFGGE